jgi:hypothetical protein
MFRRRRLVSTKPRVTLGAFPISVDSTGRECDGGLYILSLQPKEIGKNLFGSVSLAPAFGQGFISVPEEWPSLFRHCFAFMGSIGFFI